MLLMILTIGCKKAENITGANPTQGEWKLVRQAQSTGYFNALCFADQSSGWAVGDSGRILHTNNGGKSWYVQESRTTVRLKCVYFVNAQISMVQLHQPISFLSAS
jgi:photosystem II stability/assembly factor-like uncharacterized protein